MHGALTVCRSRALVRGLTWLVPAAILGAATVFVFGGLEFAPSGVSNRLVEYSLAVVALPLPVAGAYAAFLALRWFALGLWPRRLGIFAAPEHLQFRLGPFGTRTFDARRLTIRYPFELADDEDDAAFESFLPQETQVETLLPRITHPQSKRPLNQVILRFATGSEIDMARALRPAIEAWRISAAPRDGVSAARPG